jgi:hypothetical protein
MQWHLVMSDAEFSEPLVIQIEESDSSSGATFFWECLEQKELWSAGKRPPSITVVRTIQSEHPPEKLCEQPIPKSNEKEVFNILVVTARPDAAEDIPHRLVSRSILDVIKDPINKCLRPTRMEIVRPGTFKAFCNHLESREAGYFDIVHFDLHGSTDSSG